jgi:UPF0755 protein
MKYLLAFLGVCVVVFGIIALLFIPAAWRAVPAAHAPVIRIDIPEGAGANDVARILVERKLLSTTVGYRLYASLNRMARRPRPGAYDLPFGMSYRAIAVLLATGPAREETTVRVLEGWTIEDIREALLNSGVTSTLSDFVDASGTSYEGYLFPDTYRVWKDQLPQSLIKKQREEFATKTEGFASEAAAQGRSLRDVVILASIVEKEARHDEDRPIIAGIFLNRMRSGMRLQSDATLNYILSSGRSRLTAEDLKNPSPYNTYLHDGLPPGPISNPGLASLNAALHPAKTDYYFFLTDAEGKTYYARTLEEHIKNRYRAYRE